MAGTADLRENAGMRWTFAAAVLAAVLAACTSGPPAPVDERPYEEQVAAERAAKDEYFRMGGESPIPEVERATFPGLSYFPVDAAYRVPASFREERQNPPVIILMATSADRPRRMQHVGTLVFVLHGTSHTLSAYVEEGQSLQRLFVPFGDLTNGVETYDAGRNLELDRTATGLYDLDFNAAYHPYCLYNAAYDCPIPPAANRLGVPIRAGERLAP
jgi:uncharacterized protein (DUF1684 family)